jgi:hypothetical protein
MQAVPEIPVMNAYETSTTVGGQGEIHLAGVPFQPGAEVGVIISLKSRDASPGSDVGDRLGPLFAALDHARNDEPIGSLRREELYDRNTIH